MLMAVTVQGAPAAQAGNFGGCSGTNEPCFANNNYHTFIYNLGPRMRTALERTRTESYETTDLTTAVQGSAADSNAEDVYAEFVRNLPFGAVGQYLCVYAGASGTCNHGHVRFDDSQIGGFSDAQLQSLACHEVGHSVGLLHGPYECIQSGQVSARYLGSHNVAHINGRY